MRALSWKRLAAAGVLAAAVPAAMLWVGVRACGPDWEPEVFVSARPEKPALFADGHLGILQGSYYHVDLVVAYRLLSGGTLSDAEKASYTGGMDATGQDRDSFSGPAVGWLKARQIVGDIPIDRTQPQSFMFDTERAFKTNAAAGIVEVSFQLNCGDSAFTTAIDTLHQRTDRWGVNSPELVEWAHGQDAVFSNCSKAGSMPDAAKPEWPLLLRQDRAYQIAAAKFYSGDYDGAIADFEAIGKDKASPWNLWGEYLAARAQVRKAASIAKPAEFNQMANFDQGGLKAAETRLLKVEKESQDIDIRSAAAAELGFVEVRLNPGKQLDRVAEALAGPKPDPQFDQDFADLNYLMDRGVTGASDLGRWIQSMQGAVPPTRASFPATPAANPANALELWRQTPTLPWLVAALAHRPAQPAPANDLLDAAAKVAPGSPAYETVSYYRVQRLLDAGRTADARTLLTAMLTRLGPDAAPSTRNAFLAARMPTAHNLAEFLADAPRTMIAGESSAAEMAHCGATQTPDPNACPSQQFDADTADSMNATMPLATWEDAAESPLLPKNLRDSVAWAAWMRALGLGDEADVKRMAVLLPAAVEKTAGDSDGFPAVLALLRNPGLRPYMEQGVQRSATYAEMDEYRDNWWCGRWADGGGKGGFDPADEDNGKPRAPLHMEFLSASEIKQAADEVARLNALPDGSVWLGQRAIAYVKAHPDDKDAAEALALTVTATHYSCSGQSEDPAQKAVSKEAFELLHSKYPKSEWALKTKYYY